MHGPGEFTGEINMLSARRSLVRGAHRHGRRRSSPSIRDDLRALVQRDSELSEILMRAFILRRRGAGGRGQQRAWCCSARATRRRPCASAEFLTRNGQPFTYQDVETDPGVQALLDRFHVGVDEVPVVVCQRRPRAAATRPSRRWPRCWG